MQALINRYRKRRPGSHAPRLGWCPVHAGSIWFVPVLDMLSVMGQLKQVTIEYVESEDRLQMAGRTFDGQVIAVWLSQRLLLRLLPHLFGWLERQGTAWRDGAIFLEFAQAAAIAVMRPAGPVRVPVAATGPLMRVVELSGSSGRLSLQFKEGLEAHPNVRLSLDSQQLRQWLAIVHGRWRLADWPAAVWPAWLAGEREAYLGAQAGALH